MMQNVPENASYIGEILTENFLAEISCLDGNKLLYCERNSTKNPRHACLSREDSAVFSCFS